MSFDVRSRLSMLKSSAKQRGINVNLDINRYQVVIDSGCYFCGDDLKNEKGYCLDRIDNTKGYTIQNIVGCCKICNRAKSNMDVFDFINWVDRASKQIAFHKNQAETLQSFGITQELYDQLAEAWMKKEVGNKSPDRLKITNTDNT